MKYKVGDKIKFKKEKQRYTIRACDERFIIATKPFNARKTYFYVIVDLVEKIRGSDNYHCRFNYENNEEANKALQLLNDDLKKEQYIDAFYISSRNRVKLDIEEKL
jgi:hypothetical protein